MINFALKCPEHRKTTSTTLTVSVADGDILLFARLVCCNQTSLKTTKVHDSWK